MNTIEITKMSSRNTLIYLGFALLVIYFCLFFYNIEIPLLAELYALGFTLLAAANLIYFKKSNWVIVGIIGFLIVFYNIYRGMDLPNYSLERPILASLLLIISTWKVNIESMLKISFYIKFFLIGVCIVLFYLGIIPEHTNYSPNGELRHSLGFIHPNTLGMMVLTMSFEMIYVFRRFEKYVIPIAFLLNYVVNQVCLSRTSLLVCTLFIIFYIVLKLVAKYDNTRFIIYFLWTIIVFTFTCMLLASYLYGDNLLLKQLDELLSNRIAMGHAYLSEYGINLFGAPISELLREETRYWKDTSILDSAYLRIVIKYGMLAFCLILFIVLKQISKFVYAKDWLIVSLLLAMLIFGITEMTIYNFFLIPVLLLFLKK